MSLVSDIKVLYHMVLKPVRGRDHAARLESFYGGQAGAYDDFRKRLLKGRQEMYSAVEVPAGGTWVDLGGGTGSNLEYLAERMPQLSQVYVVDLAPSLLKVCGKRAEERGWKNVQTIEADATTYQPPTGPVDLVTCSYSLTMIPDWFAAIDNALAMLKPGGKIGVVDFYVSRKYPADGLRRHSWFSRTFWPTWFGGDNVFPSSDHVPYLHRHFEPLVFSEHKAKLPYVPFIRAPYYIFVGQKRAR